MRIIKFTALWCADCIVMRSAWKKVVAQFPNLEIVDFDYDTDETAVAERQIKKVPLTIFESAGGEELVRKEGMMDFEEIVKVIENFNKQ